MKQQLIILISIVCLGQFFQLFTTAQTVEYEKDYFRSPLGIPLVLSGTFGELRNNHFHAGIDIKTKGVEGQKIYASAEGYVSRVRVSPYGYGRALYIDHPNGYTTVYGHLQKFSPEIEKYIKEKQYEQQMYEVDLYVPADILTVEKGEVVAHSGNSGSSSAPHLHFEIRETTTEFPVNPLLFGFNIKDSRQPEMPKIAIYGFDAARHPSENKLILNCQKKGKEYKLSKDTILVNSDLIGVAVKTFDRLNGAENKNGVFAIQMKVDDILQYDFKVDELSFDQMRYINAHCDYDEWHRNRSWYNKCYIEPNNRLMNYQESGYTGHIETYQSTPRKIEIIIEDIAKNQSTLVFYVRKDKKGKTFSFKTDYHQLLYHSISNEVMEEEMMATFSPDAFYNDVFFDYKRLPGKTAYSATHQIHDSATPIHVPFDVLIKAKDVPESLRDKLVIMYEYKKSTRTLIPESWSGDFVKGQSKSFGKFYIKTDTAKPQIKPVYTYSGKNLAKYDVLRFKISDNLSGVKSYNGYLDGEWVLMSYHPKSRQIRYYFDKKLSKGKHTFKVEVIDAVNNSNTYSFNFMW